MRGLRRRVRGKGRDGGDAAPADAETTKTETGEGQTDRAEPRRTEAAEAVSEAEGTPREAGAPDASAEDGSDSATGGEHGAKGRSRLTKRLFPVVSGIVIVALVVVMGLLLWQRYAGDGTTPAAHNGTLQSPAIDVAEKVVMGITNINPDTVESNADTVLSHSTGTFHDDYAAAKGQFATLVGKADASSTGHIVQSGLESIEGDTATVLVVVSTDVQNKALPEASQRGYRLRVTLEKEGDSYKVSNLEQVP